MSVSALISQFSNASTSTDSPPQSPDIVTRGSISRRHYSTSSVGSSRSDSPSSCRSNSPQNRHMSVGNDSKPKLRLGKIAEDRIRMFNSQCQSAESTDGPPLSPSGKRTARRQLSAGSNEPVGLKVPARRQLSAGNSSPGLGTQRSTSPFRLPGLATTASGECAAVVE